MLIVLGYCKQYKHTRVNSKKTSSILLNCKDILKGAIAEGHVTGYDIQSRIRGMVICRVTYVYTYEGKPYTSEQEVRQNHILTHGTKVQVRCLPQDPYVARLTGVHHDNSKVTRLFVQALTVFLAAMLFLVILPHKL
jgi:hypothetical protein